MTDILEHGMDEARDLIASAIAKRPGTPKRMPSDLISRTRMPGDTPFVGTDSDGNYWGYIYDADGKRIRVCIPAK